MVSRVVGRLQRPALAGLLLAVGLAGGACRPGGEPGGLEASVRAVVRAQREAWNRGDLEGFMAGYWRSDSLTFYSGGDVSQGWQAAHDRYLRRYRSEGREMGRLDFDLREVAVTDRDHALVYGAWRLTRRADSPHGLFTLVLRRFPGTGWRIVHDHTSVAE
jgi:ketosteroid isomerase-like protein